MERKGLIVLLSILAVIGILLSSITYAVENFKIDEICFKGYAERKPDNSTFKYYFTIRHCSDEEMYGFMVENGAENSV